MIKVTCPPATAVNQLNTSYIIDILVITFPTAHLCKIYLTLILSIQSWAQFSKWMVKGVVLNAGINSTGITIISSVILRTTCYLIKNINGFVVPCHLLSKHPCVLHFHPGWSDLSSLGSRERRGEKEKKTFKVDFKVTSPTTCFNAPPTPSWDLCVNSCIMFSHMNQKNPHTE